MASVFQPQGEHVLRVAKIAIAVTAILAAVYFASLYLLAGR